MKRFSFSLPVTVLKEKDQFIVWTPVLDISTSGQTLQVAQQNFSELVKIFFEELDRKNTTEEVLLSLGWRGICRLT